jgi:outer membrane protein assembly factor BamB
VLGCGLNSQQSGKLWGLEETTGKVAWKKAMANDVQTSSPVPQKDGTFIVGSIDGALHAVDAATGTSKWTWKAKAGIWATTAVGSDGTLYVGSHDGNLYALGFGEGKEL